MKTISHKLLMIAGLAIILGITIVSCQKEKLYDGSMTVKMTDAPANLVKVNVEVVGFEVNHDKNGWISLPIREGIYDLLELQNNVNVILADQVAIPVGKINQVRLVLGTQNSIQDTIAVYPLKIPSGMETGLKLNVDQVIEPNKTVEIVLDFDVNESIVIDGTNSYSLKPVLKLKSLVVY